MLITGESGTGKEVYARFIRDHSARGDKPFVAINCAAIPENMLEATLFGYEKGAFTGALGAHAGKFEQAQGGTLLLDEISEMDLGLQAKILRVLQEREVERLGGNRTISLDVRVIATSNRDLRGGGAGRPLPRGPVLPAERACRCGCRRCASGAATSCRWRGARSQACARRRPAPCRRCRPTPSASCCATTGRATRASSTNIVQRAAWLAAGGRDRAAALDIGTLPAHRRAARACRPGALRRTGRRRPRGCAASTAISRSASAN